jgi:EpsI family protein
VAVEAHGDGAVVTVRALILAAAIAAAGLYAAQTAGAEAPIDKPALAALPTTLGAWTAASDTPLDAASLEILKVDDYLNRTYAGPDGRRVNLYVGYWASQRQGDSIHSPQNCLPGSGWQPVESSRMTLPVDQRQIPVTRYLIERGGERQLAYYWFQGRGRITADEYANKLWLLVDAARLHRSNGALVRVMTPLTRADRGEAAGAAMETFVRQVFPRLEHYLP